MEPTCASSELVWIVRKKAVVRQKSRLLGLPRWTAKSHKLSVSLSRPAGSETNGFLCTMPSSGTAQPRISVQKTRTVRAGHIFGVSCKANAGTSRANPLWKPAHPPQLEGRSSDSERKPRENHYKITACICTASAWPGHFPSGSLAWKVASG